MTVAIVGSGRTGSLLAEDLARKQAGLCLIDPDQLEDHSLDAMAVADSDVGRAKVEAVADYLRTANPAAAITTVATGVDSASAIDACTAADFLISAVDNDRARLVVAQIAARYVKVHLDIGTGVFRSGRRWWAGADVRLILPGDQRCLLCAGGLPRIAVPEQPQDWRAQREGSLRSLNQIAVGVGSFLVERLFVGALETTTWRRLELDAEGNISVPPVTMDLTADCPVCALTGMGDDL